MFRRVRAGRDAGTAEQRFEALFRANFDRVTAYARRRVIGEAVDDVVAEVFLTAWRRLDDLKGDPLPWLLGVARKVVATQHRSSIRRLALVEKVRANVKQAPEPPEATVPQVAEALKTLSQLDREALLLIAWDDLTPTQAAGVLGISPTAFRVRLHRAKRRLAKNIDGSEPAAAAARSDIQLPTLTGGGTSRE